MLHNNLDYFYTGLLRPEKPRKNSAEEKLEQQLLKILGFRFENRQRGGAVTSAHESRFVAVACGVCIFSGSVWVVWNGTCTASLIGDLKLPPGVSV